MQEKKKIFIKTLGCKANAFDSHALINQFRRESCAIVDKVSQADLCIINTCSVTEGAERDSRYHIRRSRRMNPDSKIIVTGCYAQVNSAELAKMPEVDYILPNSVKTEAVSLLLSSDFPHASLPEGMELIKNNHQSPFKSSLVLFDKATSTKTRAYLKVQDGCNGFCRYCLIPYARGASRSVQKDKILDEVQRLEKTGTKEIVLTGIHIDDYGLDFSQQEGSYYLTDLIEDILQKTGLIKLRISSIGPNGVSSSLLRVLSQNIGRFCPHFHLPLQSGCDQILEKMGRGYTAENYTSKILMIRGVFPEASIGADVIVGFPGESEKFFLETYELVRSLQLSYLHVFPYSSRPNTAAAKMPHHLCKKIIHHRVRLMQQLSEELFLDYMKKFIGTQMEVLWESSPKQAKRSKGITGNYLPVVSTEKHSFSRGDVNTCVLKGLLPEGQLLAVPIEV